MTKVEEKALNAYPVSMVYNDYAMEEYDINEYCRDGFEEGYNLALADVKDEIARLMRKTDCKNIRGHAAMRAYNEVFDFLDEQSK